MITKKVEIFRSFLYFFAVFMACSAGSVIVYDKSMDIINNSYENSVYAYENISKDGVLNLSYPSYGETISSPLNFYGSVKGDWFFEGVFPVKIVDKAGSVVGFGVAEAETDYMTNQAVSFSGTITFSTNSESGFVVFEKDNPAGFGEVEKFKLPVKFK